MSSACTSAIVPHQYDVTIWSSPLSEPCFGGVVHLLANVSREVETVELDVGSNQRVSHAAVSVMPGDAGTTPSCGPEVVPTETQDGQVVIRLPPGLVFPKDSSVRISLAFTSPFNPQPEGFYLSGPQGDAGTIALTQFQPFGARCAFPCIDHPAAKAAVSIRIVHTAATEAVSNMPIAGKTALGIDPASDPDFLFASKVLKFSCFDLVQEATAKEQWVSHQFSVSPPMPTYLVAWAVGQFASAESSYTSLSGRAIPIRVLAPATKEVHNQGRWAADFAARAMSELEHQIGVEYHLPKLDLLACDNLAAKGMENWGLITAHEQVLLTDPGRLGPAALFPRARTIVHECAHECGWGNLVTMRDFSELWCNEGSATYIGEVIALSSLLPESKADEMFVAVHRTRALELDALRSTHAVVNRSMYSGRNVKKLQAEVNETFDAISYSKGACLLRMVAHMIGLPTFIQGGGLFLRRHALGSATSDDLWAAIGEVCSLDIVKVVDEWIHQEGYPLLTVDVDTTGNKLTVKQQRFLSDGTVAQAGKTHPWFVPLFLRAISLQGQEVASLPSLALEWKDEHTFALPEVPEGACWVVNSASAGFYRVQYSPTMLQKLIPHLKSGGVLSDLDRARLLEDSSALARSGVGETSALLSLAMGLTNDDSLPVLVEVSSVFTSLAGLFFQEPEEVQQALHRAAACFYFQKLLKLGFMPEPDDSEETQKCRFMCIAGAAMSGEPNAVGKMKEFFAFPESMAYVPDMVLATIYMASVRYGGKAEWEQVYSIYLAPATPAHREAAIAGLTASRDPELIQRTVDFVFARFKTASLPFGSSHGGDGDHEAKDEAHPWRPSKSMALTDSDLLAFCGCMAGQPTLIRTLLFQAVREHWTAIRRQMEGGFLWGRLISASLGSLSSEQDLDEVARFVKMHPEVGVAGAQSLEVIASSNRWLRACRADVHDWLQKHGF